MRPREVLAASWEQFDLRRNQRRSQSRNCRQAEREGALPAGVDEIRCWVPDCRLAEDLGGLWVIDVLVLRRSSREFVAPGTFDESEIAAMAAWWVRAFSDLGDGVTTFPQPTT